MKIFYLLTLLLLLLVQSASGQVAAPVSSTTDTSLVAAKRLTAADTIRAIHRLFKQRRTVGSVLVVSAGTLVAIGLSDVVESGGNAAFFTGASAYAFVTVLAAIYTAPLYIPGLIIRGQYSKKKEAVLIADYNLKRTIPNKYLRKLKPHFFEKPSVK
ncbi:hypothetical protein [Hymenobacter sp. B1770]|uniref:hypothetical protein n=1 Tax=Hymenobacter sp. B1770 TaxID=1718788 RepID=UPI003CE9B921